MLGDAVERLPDEFSWPVPPLAGPGPHIHTAGSKCILIIDADFSMKEPEHSLYTLQQKGALDVDEVTGQAHKKA